MDLNLFFTDFNFRALYGLSNINLIPWLANFWTNVPTTKGAGAKPTHDRMILDLTLGFSANVSGTPAAQQFIRQRAQELRSQLPQEANSFKYNQTVTIKLEMPILNQSQTIYLQYTPVLQNAFAGGFVYSVTNLGNEKNKDILARQYLAYLTYYALVKKYGTVDPVSQISTSLQAFSIICPLQGKILSYEIKDWDYAPWLKEFEQIFVAVILKQQPSLLASFRLPLSRESFLTGCIGPDLHRMMHGSGHPSYLLDALGRLPVGSASQLMIEPNDWLEQRQLCATIAQIIDARQLKIIIHGNLGWNSDLSAYSQTTNYTKSLIIKTLWVCQQCHWLGVVLHVPKGSLDAYTRNLKGICQRLAGQRSGEKDYILDYTREWPRIFIENTAGQGSDMLTTLPEFIDFFNHGNLRDSETQRMLGVVVDTCHAFSNMYEPLEYLTQVKEQLGSKYYLYCHFNDSKTVRGAHYDEHAWPGEGYVGPMRFIKIRNYLLEHKIPSCIEVG